jgi:hypothetical protein
MKTIKLNVSLEVGFNGADRHDIIEIDMEDNATDDMEQQLCEQAASDWAFQYIEIGWAKIEEKP